MKKELLYLAEKEYRMKIHKYSIIHDTEKTRVLSLDTNRGKFILKTLYQPTERQLFILEAENFLRKNKINIPKTVFTKREKPFIMFENHPYILQEWITGGTNYPLLDQNRMKIVGFLLGKIHRASLGFSSSRGSQFVGANNWEQTFEGALSYMQEWKEKHSHSNNIKMISICSQMDYFLEMGTKIYERCMNLPYFNKWKSLPLIEHYLCHGDFHTTNLLVTKSKFYIIDWEDVRYDFPSKDIMRLVSFMMKTRYPKWSAKRFELIFSSYLKSNPLSHQEKGLLFHDIAFPHIFVRYLRKKLYQTMPIDKVDEFITAEKNKTEYMYEHMLKYEPRTHNR